MRAKPFDECVLTPESHLLVAGDRLERPKVILHLVQVPSHSPNIHDSCLVHILEMFGRERARKHAKE